MYFYTGVRAVRKFGDRQECMTFASLGVSDLSFKCDALENSGSLNGVEVYHPCFFFFPLPLP